MILTLKRLCQYCMSNIRIKLLKFSVEPFDMISSTASGVTLGNPEHWVTCWQRIRQTVGMPITLSTEQHDRYGLVNLLLYVNDLGCCTESTRALVGNRSGVYPITLRMPSLPRGRLLRTSTPGTEMTVP